MHEALGLSNPSALGEENEILGVESHVATHLTN